MAELTVPQVDFSSLGQLPQIYKQGQADALRQQTLANLGNGSATPQDVVQAGIKIGDLQLAGLGVSQQNRSADDIWRREQAAQAQKNADRSYKLQERGADRADQTQLEKANERGAVLDANKIDRNSPEGKAFMLSGEWTGPGAGGASLNPIYGTDINGKPASAQLTKTGKAIPTQYPEGFQIAKDPIKVDTGTTIKLIDPQTRQVISEVQKSPAELERQKTIGDEIAKAQKSHPQVVASGQQILKTISDIESDPALWSSVGSYGGIPAFPGSPGANFNAKAAQLKGQTFLQAYQTLKGGGAITDIEGAKGENALARLDTAQNEKEYRAALKDFRQVIQGGMLRSAAMARGEIGPPTEDPSFSPAARSGPTGPTTQIPPAAIDALKSNPALKADFEAKYGPGTAGVVLR